MLLLILRVAVVNCRPLLAKSAMEAVEAAGGEANLVGGAGGGGGVVEAVAAVVADSAAITVVGLEVDVAAASVVSPVPVRS